MKKILSLIMVVVMCFAMAVTAIAEDTVAIIVSDSVTLRIDGSEVTDTTVNVENGTTVEIIPPAESVIAVKTQEGDYYPVNTPIEVTKAIDFTGAANYTLGLSLVNGAQVRVGNVELKEDDKMDVVSDSGLRFVAQADYSDTVIADKNVEFGIKITAESSEDAVYIPAEKFQKADRSVFTAALTNLRPENYNRKYTATCYAKVPMFDGSVKEFVTGSVTRSIYQVSVGIMKNSSAEASLDMPYTIDDAVKNVLNAYINQTGIRLTYSVDGKMTARTTGNGAYTGDLFFDIASSVNDDGSANVVITPLGEDKGFGNKVAISSWWQDYIRVNNNNTEAKEYISDVKLENGVLSFKFTVPVVNEYTFNQEDNVTVVSEITSEYIKGFKAGEEVSYKLSKAVVVMGISESLADVVPGSVVLIAENTQGECGAIELLASLGMPIDPEKFEDDFGVHDAADGSTKYKNVVTELFEKVGTKLTCQNLPDTTKTVYDFESKSSMCYRIGIAMDGDTPVVTATGSKISKYPSIFEDTVKYHNYLYLRYNSETGKVKECVFYCVPQDLDFTGDGEFSDIFSVDSYRVIIE